MSSKDYYGNSAPGAPPPGYTQGGGSSLNNGETPGTEQAGNYHQSETAGGQQQGYYPPAPAQNYQQHQQAQGYQPPPPGFSAPVRIAQNSYGTHETMTIPTQPTAAYGQYQPTQFQPGPPGGQYNNGQPPFPGQGYGIQYSTHPQQTIVLPSDQTKNSKGGGMFAGCCAALACCCCADMLCDVLF